jgi:hypothetical protein
MNHAAFSMEPVEAPQPFVGPIEVNEKQLVHKMHEFWHRIWEKQEWVDAENLHGAGGFLDGHEGHANHWVILKDNEIVAVARLCIHNAMDELPDYADFANLRLCLPSPIAALNRLAVGPNVGGHGFSRLLDVVRIKRAIERGAASIMGQALPYRYRSLTKLGFSPCGNSFERCLGKLPLTIMVTDLRHVTSESRAVAAQAAP